MRCRKTQVPGVTCVLGVEEEEEGSPGQVRTLGWRQRRFGLFSVYLASQLMLVSRAFMA